MGNVEKIGGAVGAALLLGLVGLSCGSGGEDNDQGISFRTVGIFQGERQQDQCQVPTTETAISDQSAVLPLHDPELDGGFPNSGSALSFCRGFLELQNNLLGQGIALERIDFEYEIPGARISIPSSSAPTGLRINPADANPDTNPNPSGQVNVVFTHLDGQLIPSRLVLFLRQNQLSLPALPYVMIIHVTVRGRTDSGNVLVSNETRYTVEWQ
ncbi:MAG: hypothetical protein ACREQ3_03185 [Candidatus Binatia bacterium]